jgi:lysophospholipase L1-like esterase
MKAYTPFLWLAKKLGYTEPSVLTHWQDRVINLATGHSPKQKIVLLGDSITEGWATTHLLDGCLNYGVAGDMTNGTLALLGLIEKIEPRRVILNIGTNDIGFGVPLATTIINYTEILQKLISIVGAENVIACAIRPVNITYPIVAPRTNETIVCYNREIEKLCVNKGVIFEPDTYTCHLRKLFNDLYPEHTIDGLHLRPTGYLAEMKVLQKYIA